MQWDASPQAGFTTVTKPWLPIPPTSAKYNVETESKEADSIFNAYKRLLCLRKSEPALRDGVQVSIGDDPNVFAYLRKANDESIVVLLNMSDKERTFAFKPAEYLPNESSKLEPLYSSVPVSNSLSPSQIVLPPFAALVEKVQ
jgi:glycosidase